MSTVHHTATGGLTVGPFPRGWHQRPAVVDDLPLGLLVADSRGRVVMANQAWSELSGLEEEASLGHGWLRCIAADDRRQVLDEVHRRLSGRQRHSVDFELCIAGERRWTRWWFAVRNQPKTTITMTVADVHADHVLHDELQHRTFHDPLTGLVNRSHLFELIERALRGHRRDHSMLAVLYIDLDRFKEINDQFGHATGDRVLTTVAAALQGAVRPQDVLARVGGDEFAVVCDQLQDPSDAVVVAERMQEALSVSIDLSGTPWTVTASVGLALAEGEDDSPATLLDRADQAMYRCKAAASRSPRRRH